MFRYSEVRLNNFAGGITDRYVDGTPSTSKELLNLSITKFNTLELRHGFKWYLEAGNSGYATSGGIPFMGLLRLENSDNVIISQGGEFHILNDEVEFDLNLTDDTGSEEDPTEAVTPTVGYLKSDLLDTATAAGLLNGTVAVEASSNFSVNDKLNIASSGGVTRESASHGNFYVKSKPTGTTIILSDTVDGDALDLRSTIEAGDKIYTEWLIDFGQAHEMVTGDEVYFKNVGSATDHVSDDTAYYFIKSGSTNGKLAETPGGASADLATSIVGTTGYRTITLVKKASTTEILPPGGTNLLLVSATSDVQPVCFTEWQDQLMVTSRATSSTLLTRPGRIFYGAIPLLAENAECSTGNFSVTSHGLAEDEQVKYELLSGKKEPDLVDGRDDYLIVRTNADTFKISTSADDSTALAIDIVQGISKFTPITQGWKCHTMGLPVPCVEENGSLDYSRFSVTKNALSTGTTKVFQYACVYKYIYNSNGVEYTTYGPTRTLNATLGQYTISQNEDPGKYIQLGTTTSEGDGSGVVSVSDATLFSIGQALNFTSAANDKTREDGTDRVFYVIAVDTTAKTITLSATSGGSALNISAISEETERIASGDKIYTDGSVHATNGSETNITSVAITVPYLGAVTSGLYLNNQWDVKRVTIEIYRTKGNGSVFYYVGEKRNNGSSWGTASFLDDKTDIVIGNNKALYTTGGAVVQLQPAPPCKYVISSRDTAYYANVIEETESINMAKFISNPRPTRVYQSIPGIPGSIGDTFYTDLDDHIVGIGEARGMPIVFTDTYVYRIEGIINADGSGSMRAKVIDENVGCCSHGSIVKTPKGLFWAGRNGFQHTDGYTVTNLTEHLEESFAVLARSDTTRSLITGTYDEREDRISWAVAEGTGSTADVLWVLHLRSMAFTKTSAPDFEGGSLMAKDEFLYRGDTYGNIYVHSEEQLHDKIISFDGNNPNPVHAWKRQPILFKYKSNTTSFGIPAKTKWVSDATFSLLSKTNLGVKPISSNDASNVERDMKEIFRVNTWKWQDPDFVWRERTFEWGAPDVVTGIRRFPRKELRCRRKQVGLEAAPFVRHVSDDWYETTVTKDAETGLLTARATKWPDDLSGGQICFNVTISPSTGRETYDEDSTTIACYNIYDNPTSKTLRFYAGAFDGWKETSGGRYLTVPRTVYPGVDDGIFASNLFAFDDGEAAGSKETKTLGVTKDWSISFRVKGTAAQAASAAGEIIDLGFHGGSGVTSHGPWVQVSWNYLQVRWKDSTVAPANYPSYSFDNFGNPNKLVMDGVTWNHILITFNGTAEEDDNWTYGASNVSEGTTGMSVYVNGEAQVKWDDNDATVGSTYSAGSQNVKWEGSMQSGGIRFLPSIHSTDLQWDDFVVFNEHKTAAKALTLYNEGSVKDLSTDTSAVMWFTAEQLPLGAVADNTALTNEGSDASIEINMDTTDAGDAANDMLVSTQSLKWTIKKYALEQKIEIKEVDIKFAVMDNIDGRFQSEAEVENA